MTPILDLRQLTVDIHLSKDTIHVLRGVTMQIEAGSRTAIVGESGSGKTLTALATLRLLPTTARIVGGQALFEGRDLLALSEAELSQVRGAQIAMIFQHAAASLNPLYPVGKQIADVYRYHFGGGQKEAWERAVDVLAATGIPNPQDKARDYPYQYSGGMAQRALIAMALVCRPKLLIADEPTSGLDVTIQTQVLDLIGEVVEQIGATLVLITHDLAVVSAACDRMVVMYAGGVMEQGTVTEILNAPANPYTGELLKCFAEADGDAMPYIPGRVPDMRERWSGCSFAPRCPLAVDRCQAEPPPLMSIAPGHASACHFAADLRATP